METYKSTRGIRPETDERSEAQVGHSIADLLRELREETVTLARQEVALAKTEMKEKAGKLGRNVAYLAVGGLIAYAGLIFLLFAGMRGLTFGLVAGGMNPETALWLSPLIIGLVVLLIGVALAMKAKNAMARESLVPEKTIQSLKEETSWTRAKLKEA
ncbi:MAG: phage holin family protein [Verrucomicrobia bacterium]|nr:phage holin family protein [Verrucomicrobiota bacterium]